MGLTPCDEGMLGMTVSHTTPYERVTDALRSAGMRVIESSSGKARSQCPAHGSRGLSLEVGPLNPDGRCSFHCHGGCDAPDVLAELGLTLSDLYPPRDPQVSYRPSVPRVPQTPWDRVPSPEHFADRALQQEAAEATPEYWDRRGDELEASIPRLGDFPGMDPDAELYNDAAWLAGRSPAVPRSVNPVQVREVQAKVRACRNRSALLRRGLS